MKYLNRFYPDHTNFPYCPFQGSKESHSRYAAVRSNVATGIILVLLLTCGLSIAQTGDTCTYTLSGKVIDEHDGQPLDFANIWIRELRKGAVTDSTGHYRVTGLCAGTYTVVCSHLGCETIQDTITVIQNTVRNFYPEHHVEVLGAIEIRGKKPEEKSTQAIEKIQGRALDKTKGQSLGESLKQATGVTTLNTGSGISKPVIHGLHSNRVLILNNGVRQEGQQWGTEHAPEIDPFIAGRLTVVKGANSVRYGSDAIAGVVLVEPRPLRDSAGISGELNLVAFSNGRQGAVSPVLDGNFRKIPAISWRAQGTFKRSGNVHTSRYFLKNTGLREYNFSWTTAYKKENYGVEIFYSQFNTDMGIFSGAHIGNLTDLQRAFEATEPLESSGFSYEIDRPRQHIEHELFKTKAFLQTGKAGKLNLTYARQYNRRFEYDKHKPLNDSLAALNLPELQLEITTHTADLIWEHSPTGAFTGQGGITGMTQENTYAGRLFIPNFLNRNAGVFWIERWRHNKLELEGGIRYDRRFLQVFMRENGQIVSPEFTYENASGTFGAIYPFSDKLSAGLNIGTAWRPPSASELFSDGVHHGAAAVEKGDRDLSPENAIHFMGELNYGSDLFRITVSPYYNHIRNFIYLAPQLPPTLTIRGAFPTFHYKQADVHLKGADFTGSVAFSPRFHFTSRVSLLRAFNRSANAYLALMPSDRHEGSLEYRWPGNGRFKDSYISATLLHVAKQWRVSSGGDFVPPPDAYMLLGLDAGATLAVGKQEVQIGLSVQNLLNASYRDYMNRFRYYADDLGRNISLRLTIPLPVYQPK